MVKIIMLHSLVNLKKIIIIGKLWYKNKTLEGHFGVLTVALLHMGHISSSHCYFPIATCPMFTLFTLMLTVLAYM